MRPTAAATASSQMCGSVADETRAFEEEALGRKGGEEHQRAHLDAADEHLREQAAERMADHHRRLWELGEGALHMAM